MRTRLTLATLFVSVAQFGVVACNHGRNYDPQHRLKRAAGPEAPPKKDDTKAKAPATAPGELASVFDPAAAIADRQWCRVHKKNGTIFFVDRFVFSSEDGHRTLHDQLVFIPGQAPFVKDAKDVASWTDVTDKKLDALPDVAVHALTSEAATEHADAGDQNVVFRDLTEMHSLERLGEAIGSNGAVEFTPKGEKPVLLFDCQDYSPVFVGLEKPEEAPAQTAAQPPVAPDAELQASVGPFKGALKAVAADPAKFVNTRWCSYKKSLDDVIVGTLEFGAKNEVTLNHFKASMLKSEKTDKRTFRKAMISKTISLDGVRTQNNVVSAPPLVLRHVVDASGKRALIFDSLANDAYPASTAETFFECAPANDQSGDPLVLENLTKFMNSKRR